jgi:hypothetical protein
MKPVWSPLLGQPRVLPEKESGKQSRRKMFYHMPRVGSYQNMYICTVKQEVLLYSFLCLQSEVHYLAKPASASKTVFRTPKP